MPTKAFVAMAWVISALLAVVIFIGFVQQKLDPNGTAVALCGVLSGLIGGVILRGKQDDKADSDKKDAGGDPS